MRPLLNRARLLVRLLYRSEFSGNGAFPDFRSVVDHATSSSRFRVVRAQPNVCCTASCSAKLNCVDPQGVARRMFSPVSQVRPKRNSAGPATVF
jgi:hypothetical protein